MNNEKFIEDINQKNEIFIRELMNKNSFMLDWYAGAVVPKHHPRYYDGRIEVNIRKAFNSSYGNINFGKDEYQVSNELVNNLYNYIETNINKLIKISLNQSTEMYEGVRDVLRIKFKSIYISISGINASSEEEKNEIAKIKEDLKNIITVNKVVNNNSSENKISDEQIETIITELAGTDDIHKNSLLSTLTKKVIALPVNEETTIAKLMQLNDNIAIDPLTQGELFNLLKSVCEKLNIAIEVNHDEFGGLGYHYKFKKIDNRKDSQMNIEEKKEIAKRVYKELGFETDNFQIEKIEEINADIFLPADNQRGIGGVIIGNDGSYHVCGSINPLQYYIDEFKSGVRDNIENNESLKLSNGKYAEDIETKQAFDGYMSKVDKYNEQVANGEKPDVKMGDLLNEYTDTFYDEALEEKMKKTEEDFNNREKDTRIDDLIDSINEKLKDTEPPKILKCPICGENLMFMEPDGNTLHCRKCNKFFKNNNGAVGDETTDPYPDPTALY